MSSLKIFIINLLFIILSCEDNYFIKIGEKTFPFTLKDTAAANELKAKLDINRFTPSDLGLNGDYANFNYSLQAIADIHASNIYDAEGIVNIKDIKISSSKSNYAFDNISLSVANDNRKSIDFKSDFAHFVLNGHYNYQTILSTIKSAPNALYPLFDITPVSTLPSNSDSFDFELTLSDHPFLHTIIKEQYQ